MAFIKTAIASFCLINVFMTPSCLMIGLDTGHAGLTYTSSALLMVSAFMIYHFEKKYPSNTQKEINDE